MTFEIRSTRTAASALLFALLAYYEIYRWVPLGRWNWQFAFPVVNDQFYPDIVIGLLLALFLVSFLRTWQIGMWAAVVLLGLWTTVHFFDWWRPYLQNSAANYGRYSFYAPHTQLLPVIGYHYPPDAGHAVLDFILFPAWGSCLLACLLPLLRRQRTATKSA